jgi:hypothetical protein
VLVAKFDGADSSPSIQEKFEEVSCGRERGAKCEVVGGFVDKDLWTGEEVCGLLS